MDKKVSVIVPVYNTQKYLKRCIDSILNQTYNNLDIILVNDGSTDDSLKICEEYAKIDDRISIISGKNYGVSHARNIGIEKAKGEYLYFADSDDYLEFDAIEKMLREFVNADGELIIAGYNEIENKEKIAKKSWGNLRIKCNDAKKLILDENGAGGYLWNKLFKLSLIKEFKIKFDEKIYVWEDVLFVMEYLDKCKNINLIDDIVYEYCRRDGSAVEYSVYTPRLYTQLNAIEKIEKFVFLDDSTKDLLEYRKVRCCLGLVRSMAIGNNVDKNTLKKIKNKLYKISRKMLRNKLSTTDKISLSLVKIHPKLFINIYCLIRKIK